MSESDKSIKLVKRNSREENTRIQNEWIWKCPDMKSVRESFKTRFKKDMADPKDFPVQRNDFSWKSVAQKFGTTIKEADSSSLFTQVLRAGVQTLVNSAYQVVDTSYEEWVHVVPSSKDTELYAPLHGISFLREIGAGEKYPEAHAAGLDIKLKNRKYGTSYAIQKELLEDDQTGQFNQQASLMGEYAKLAHEVLCMAKLASVSGAAYADMSVPASETKPSDEANYPRATSAAPLVGGGATRPVTFTALTGAAIQSGLIALMNQKNKLGLKMMVRPDRLIIGPQYQFDAKVLLNSAWYPSVPSATAGATGWTNSENVLKGIVDLTVSRFMFKNNGTVDGSSNAWYLVDSKVPWFVLQVRQGAEVQQENPQSGDSFEKDEFRFKVSLRGNADYIDPRFSWQGNDGSV